MKFIFQTAAVFALAFSLCAAEKLEINGELKNPDGNGIPSGWCLHAWKGYKPDPKIQYLGGETARVRFTEIKSKEGTAFRTAQKIPGLSGDTVIFSFSAEGKGGIYAHLYLYNKLGEWNGESRKQVVYLSGEKRNYSFNLVVPNGSKGETAKFCIVIGAFPGTEFELGNIQASMIPGKIRGDVSFPRQGMIFGPVPADFQPLEKDLCTIPSELNGKKGKKVSVKDNKVDFAPAFGNAGKRACGWFFTELKAPYGCDYTIGAGADWWMKIYVNGKPVIDTLEQGNKFSPCAVDNYKISVRLKKGSNIIAAKLIRGDSEAVLWIGGPAELRKAVRSLTLEKVLEKDDYEDTSMQRAGSPKLIQGLPAPGLLSVTTQGVYTASPSVEFPLSKRKFNLASLPGNRFFTMGLRIQNFGETEPVSSRLEYRFRNGSQNLTFSVNHDKTSPLLKLVLSSGGKEQKIGEISSAMLPVNLSFSADRNGNGLVSIGSMSTGRVMNFPVQAGNFFSSGIMDFCFVFRSMGKKTAEITVDERFYAVSAEKQPDAVPHKLTAPLVFDPEKAGWKKVFADEFDGTKIDMAKWIIRKPPAERIALDGKGHLVITIDYDKAHRKLLCPGIGTRKSYGYGYFEARVRFTKQPGWWAAFWLYGNSSWTNPFIDSTEVDIFEDYYTRPKAKGQPFRNTLDHNLHSPFGSVTKSWNFNSTIPGSLDQFHTIGCLYTPFEIAYYMDGKRIRNADSSSETKYVGFDAFTHSTSTTPLQAILSAQIMTSRWPIKASDGVFPEHYLVDYVRIYGMPSNDLPAVSWIKGGENREVKVGDTLIFEADVKPSGKTGSPVKTVYLFDSGNLIAFKTKPPYRFEIPFTQAFYDTTDFSRTGRQNRKPGLMDFHHAYSVFVQDQSGKVGVSSTVIVKLAPKGKSAPWQRKAAQIPGKLILSQYDEGGHNTAYFDIDSVNHSSKTYRVGEGVDCSPLDIGYTAWGEWLNYTVNVSESGLYEAVLLYGTPRSVSCGVTLKEDGKAIGSFDLEANPAGTWEIKSRTSAVVRLAKGTHLLTLEINGGCNLKTLEFRRKQ